MLNAHLSPPRATPLLRTPIIVVDDDRAVLHALKFAFETDGFEVLTFDRGTTLLKEPALPIHGCLILDYKMPGIDGLELLACLRARGVALPALLIGGNLTPAICEAAARMGVEVVEKPFLGDELSSKVRALLEQPR